MMDEPGCAAGRESSPRPHRGPDESHRMSFAILSSDVATVLSWLASSVAPSWAPCASKWFTASMNGISNLAASFFRDQLAETDWAVDSGSDGSSADGKLVEARLYRL